MRHHLAAEGYCIIQSALCLDALAALEQQIADLFDLFDDLPAGTAKRLSRVGQGVLEINGLFTLLPALRDGPVVARIIEVCADVLGCPVRMTYANTILKPPHGGADVLAHQDTAYDGASGHSGQRYTAWIPFRDASIERGTVYYLPGSHAPGPLPHLERDGVYYLKHLPHTNRAAKAVEISAGGFALHSSAVIHGSYPNTSNRPRLALSLRLHAS